MRKLDRHFCALLLVAGLFTSPLMASDAPSYIEAAIANPLRNPENVARDESRKPAEVLAFFDVTPGMAVLDAYASRGYFTELFSGVVGPEGKVYAHYRPGQRFDSIKDQITDHFGRFGNIDILVKEPNQTDLPDNSVDLVLLSLLYHHLHYDVNAPDVLPDSTKAILAEMKRILKPGGRFALIEHAAIAGTSRKQAADWHRIDPAMMRADIEAQGFEFAGESDIHANPGDDRQNNWGKAGLRGKTARTVQVFTKPE